MTVSTPNPFGSKGTLDLGGQRAVIFRLPELARQGLIDLDRIPFSIRILIENALRHANRGVVTEDHVLQIGRWTGKPAGLGEIPFMPARVVLQDFTGVPCVVDLAAMRDAMANMGGDAQRINPVVPCDLVIDHSVQVDHYGTAQAFRQNVALEFDRNKERYQLLKFAQRAFQNFRVVPPGMGIVHQVNLEYLAPLVQLRDQYGEVTAYPDSLVGTDSHTTMINGLGVMGWGVGGIEAEAVMLGQPYFMLIPEVIGMKLVGELPVGTTATDLVLQATNILRKHGVVDKFVEFFGPGLSSLGLADRATIANMAPEYGATMGFFPVDSETIDYLRRTGRPADVVERAERYCKENALFRTDQTPDPVFTTSLTLDLSTVAPSLAGPKRPQDLVRLKDAPRNFATNLPSLLPAAAAGPRKEAAVANGAQWENEGGAPATLLAPPEVECEHEGRTIKLRDGSVVIAAITSCTNTSNPSVMVGAGLLARKALARGLSSQPWVKTSMAPGSRVVTDYLDAAGLTEALDRLGFNTVGYGCTTCIGNSGPLPQAIEETIQKNHLVCAAVLSGNRNFEARVHPLVRANYLASPVLVVAYALAGRMDIDLTRDPLGVGSDGKPVYLADIWPSAEEIRATMAAALKPAMFQKSYSTVFDGDAEWQALAVPGGSRFAWDGQSTYVQNPPFFRDLPKVPGAMQDIQGARVLASLGDSVTTDHISPAGSIPKNGPAARFLLERGVQPVDWNTFGARRGNHEVMMRGTFGNVRIKNGLVPDKEGNWTLDFGTGEVVSIYDAAMRYIERGTPLVILAGKEYGTGSSRDWAAKGTNLLGVKAVLAESYERIHRSNLVGMGVLPLGYEPGASRESLGLTGRETFTITGIAKDLVPGGTVNVVAVSEDGTRKEFKAVVRLNSKVEIDYYRHGGILPRVLRMFLGL
ncbi:MAG: aconitate hydratase AcnA [Gemmatimonadetes bacterium]|nr:aconitate hydratase AcnA [Gemmatimonadota bacterium]